jgi:hypothetical protein
MTTRPPRERFKELLAAASSRASRLWTDERLFYVALTLFNVFLARRTFKEGIWADADSVCHYAYVRHLLEEFYPATGTFIGFTPKYDLGAPFLLYNTPPGVYVSAAVVAKLTGVSALLALKLVMLAAFLAVPILAAQLARTFVDDARDLPKFVALSLSLFSAELFGLEFYFKNGMLNPALAVPFLLTTLIFYRRAQMATGSRVLAWLALAAGGFAATTFVHLLSTYMLALTLGCCALAAGPRRAGRSLLQVGVVVALGAGLAAFWLVPSMPFAAKNDAAFTWIRRAWDTLSNYADGSMLSSYPVGFYPQFVTYSGVGIVAILCAGFGVWQAIVQRVWPVLAFALATLVALLITLGPSPSFGLSILPMYDRLLWYRFATLLELCTLLVAGWGAWQLYELRARLGNIVVHALLGGAIWAGLVMTQRAVKIETAHDYPGFVTDVDTVSAWLRDHGKPGGRVFSEFLGQDVVDSVGVNYPRHMIPILSGYPEAGGWVYENDDAAQAMMKLGVFWFDPFPMIARAARYDVQYIVAGSPNLVRVLNNDPRWRLAVATSHVSIFEAVGREPAMAEGAGWNVTLETQRYLPGGGYEYVFDATDVSDGARPGPLLVKTGWSPAWKGRIGDRELRLDRTEDALISATLPEGPPARRVVTLTWDISALRAKGDRIALAAFAVAAAMILYGFRRRTTAFTVPEWALQWGGLGGAGVALVLFAARSRPIDEHVVGFGLRGGMDVTYDARRLEVGAFDDAESYRPSRVVPAAWGPRSLVDGEVARVLVDPGPRAAVLSLSPAGPNRVTVSGSELDWDGDPRVDLVLRDPSSHEEVCRVSGVLGVPAALPGDCTQGAPGPGPGVTRDLQLLSPGQLRVHGITVDSGTVFVEAEQMHNVLDDSGYEAFYGYGPPDQLSSNGVSMVAHTSYEKPIALDREVELPWRRYEVWVLTRTVSSRLANGRAHFLIESDGQLVADMDSHTRQDLPFWDDDPHLEWIDAGPTAGGGKHRVRFTFYKLKIEFDGLGDLDAMAFVPAAP